jgi:hypothetical protein
VSGGLLVERRQQACLLAELRGRRGCASRPCALRGLLERARDVGVWSIRREREVAGAFLGVGDELGEAAMHRPPLVGPCFPVDPRGQERMNEPNAIAVELDDLPFERGDQGRLRVPAQGDADELERRLGQGRGGEKRLSGVGREPFESLLDERVEARGQRLARFQPDRAALDCPGELEREERVSARELVQATELGAGENHGDPVPQEAVERAEAERPERQPPESLLGERAVETERHPAAVPLSPLREEEHDALLLEATKPELQHQGRRAVEPLDVVDCDQQRAGLRERSHRAQEGDGDSAVIRRPTLRVLQQQSDLERPSLGNG